MCIGILVVEKFLRQKKKKKQERLFAHNLYATKYMFIRKYSKRLVFEHKH